MNINTPSNRYNSRPFQEVFDAVIGAGYYGSKSVINAHSPYMCIALQYARVAGVITTGELLHTTTEIRDYLTIAGWASLDSALNSIDLPSSYDDCLAIYSDWANRPSLIVED